MLTRKYVDFISYTNPVIVSSYYTSLVPYPPVSRPAKALNKGTRFLQNSYHLSYLARIKKETGCALINIVDSYKTPPVKIKSLKIQRDFTGEAKLRSKWSNTFRFTPNPKLNALKHTFSVKVNFKLEKSGLFFSKLRAISKEQGLVASLL